MTPSAKSELTGAESYLRAAQAFGKGRAAAPCRPDGQARLPHAGRPHLERWGLLAGASSDPAEQGPGQHAADRGPGGDDALVTPTLVSPDEALITSLLASQAYQAQIGLLARKPRPDQVEKALTALLDAGGTLPVTALAQRIGLPPIRGDGFAAVLRQLLNYDGVQVLETLPDGRTLRLSTGLLRDQFELR